MIALGTVIQIFSMVMLSFARENQYYEVCVFIYLLLLGGSTVVFQVFLAQAVGMGIGQSLLFLPSLTVIGHHFKCRRALATGIAVSVSITESIAF